MKKILLRRSGRMAHHISRQLIRTAIWSWQTLVYVRWNTPHVLLLSPTSIRWHCILVYRYCKAGNPVYTSRLIPENVANHLPNQTVAMDTHLEYFCCGNDMCCVFIYLTQRGQSTDGPKFTFDLFETERFIGLLGFNASATARVISRRWNDDEISFLVEETDRRQKERQDRQETGDRKVDLVDFETER